MLRDKRKKQEGKKGNPESAENPNWFGADPDPATVRLMTPREQWTPAQKRADKLRLGDVAGATYTAQLIDRPEDKSPALRKIEAHTANASDTAHK